MENMIKGILKYKYIVLSLFMIMIIISLFMVPKITVNYDLANYLPDDSMTKRAINIMETEFDYPGMADIMIEDVTISQGSEAKEKIQQIPGVKSVIWLDDLTDITVPQAFIPGDLLDNYYKDNNALFRVEFDDGDYSVDTGNALMEIRSILGESVNISGPAEDSRHMRDVMSTEIFKIFLVVFPLCIIVLMFASHSWIEPFIYILVIGISVVINMGTNAYFSSISFLTHSIAALLQFAISMDYSLFLSHRYIEERDKGNDVVPAITKAVKGSLSSISASALTTIAGFLALIFMQYTIGADLGLVLAKGILISFICVIILMPVFLLLLHRVIDKTRHRPLLPSFSKLGRFIIKAGYLLIALALIIIIPSFLAQRNNHFLYGDSSGSSSQGSIAEERAKIEATFGTFNPIMVLVPSGDIPQEINLTKALENQMYIRDVQTLVTIADPAIPSQYLPQNVRDMFVSDNYTRMIVTLNIDGETPKTFEAVDSIRDILQEHYPDEWLSAGVSTSILDIKNTVENDQLAVNLFSILAVGLIVMLTFRSLSIPILLITVIQGSIWINMSIPYFQGSTLVFIGFLVVSAIQLGATIDYGILMSNRYIEFRRSQKPQDAVLSALNTAGGSILISALILAIAGFTEGLLSQIPSVSEIGMLLGRGAALSGIMVLIVLPALLMTFDKIIMKTTLVTKTNTQYKLRKDSDS